MPISVIKVKPATEQSNIIRHPLMKNIALRDEGVNWPNDTFTKRRIADGSLLVVEDEVTPETPGS